MQALEDSPAPSAAAESAESAAQPAAPAQQGATTTVHGSVVATLAREGARAAAPKPGAPEGREAVCGGHVGGGDHAEHDGKASGRAMATKQGGGGGDKGGGGGGGGGADEQYARGMWGAALLLFVAACWWPRVIPKGKKGKGAGRPATPPGDAETADVSELELLVAALELALAQGHLDDLTKAYLLHEMRQELDAALRISNYFEKNDSRK